MNLQAQLQSVNKGKEQCAIAKFSCSLSDFLEISKLVQEVKIKFWITGAEPDIIRGAVSNATANNDSYTFKLKFPGSENILTSQLSTLCEQLLSINVEVDV